ncbi:MAG TPA: hypothetical protein PLS70_09000, partial [Acidobacteriota bacterium]|nr:hypothetical protein [Acidobacteriota bacterium]
PDVALEFDHSGSNRQSTGQRFLKRTFFNRMWFLADEWFWKANEWAEEGGLGAEKNRAEGLGLRAEKTRAEGSGLGVKDIGLKKNTK